MRVKLISISVVFLFVLIACESENDNSMVRNGIRIDIHESSYTCVKIQYASNVYVEIPFTMTAQGGGEVGIATFIKALGGSFVSYLDQRAEGWRDTFGRLPHDSVIETWANNPKEVAEHIKRDKKALKDVKEYAQRENITIEDAIYIASTILSGRRPTYSKLYCRANTNILLNNDKFTVVCNSPENIEGIKFFVPKTPLTPLYKEYSNTIPFSSVCGM